MGELAAAMIVATLAVGSLVGGDLLGRLIEWSDRRRARRHWAEQVEHMLAELDAWRAEIDREAA